MKIENDILNFHGKELSLSMILRHNAQELKQLLEEFPAVALLGPRQVGKTTLAKNLANDLGKPCLYFDLENEADLSKLSNIGFLFEQYQNHCIILDEVQRMPHIFAQLRPIIDQNRIAGRFILTGSASPQLIKGVSESLAGRIAYHEMTPINLLEAHSSNLDLETHWFRGGFPLALTAPTQASAHRWIQNFIKSYIERDLALIYGLSIPSKSIHNFWYMLAHNNGGIWNGENYARSLGLTGPTVKRYVDFLEGAFLVRQLQPWTVNVNKRIVKAPKVYIRDAGILHALNRVASASELPKNLSVGASWEGYVIEQIAQTKPAHLDLYYYRTHHGAECDLILVDGITPVAALEIKYSNQPIVPKGFYHIVNDLNLDNGWVIVPQGKKYDPNPKLKVCGLQHFLEYFLPSLP